MTHFVSLFIFNDEDSDTPVVNKIVMHIVPIMRTWLSFSIYDKMEIPQPFYIVHDSYIKFTVLYNMRYKV